MTHRLIVSNASYDGLDIFFDPIREEVLEEAFKKSRSFVHSQFLYVVFISLLRVRKSSENKKERYAKISHLIIN